VILTTRNDRQDPDEESRGSRRDSFDDEDNDSRGRLNKKSGPSPKTASKNRGIKDLMTRVNQQSEQIQLEIDEVSSRLLVSLSDPNPCPLARRIGERDVQTADVHDSERADRASASQKFTQGFVK